MRLVRISRDDFVTTARRRDRRAHTSIVVGADGPRVVRQKPSFAGCPGGAEPVLLAGISLSERAHVHAASHAVEPARIRTGGGAFHHGRAAGARLPDSHAHSGRAHGRARPPPPGRRERDPDRRRPQCARVPRHPRTPAGGADLRRPRAGDPRARAGAVHGRDERPGRAARVGPHHRPRGGRSRRDRPRGPARGGAGGQRAERDPDARLHPPPRGADRAGPRRRHPHQRRTCSTGSR